MSEELGVRSEELTAMLRKCSTAGTIEDCKECKLFNDCECGNTLIRLAADEIERLTKERKYLLKIADSNDCCGACRNGVMAGKPCPSFDDINDCEDCGKCICGECRDGDKWEWIGEEDE